DCGRNSASAAPAARPCRVRVCAHMLYYQFMNGSFMPIVQCEAVPPISAANSLPTAFWCAEFRCPETGETASKWLISHEYSLSKQGFSGAKTGFFPAVREFPAGLALARP